MDYWKDILILAKRVTNQFGGAQHRVPRRAKRRVSRRDAALNARAAQADANLDHGFYCSVPASSLFLLVYLKKDLNNV